MIGDLDAVDKVYLKAYSELKHELRNGPGQGPDDIIDKAFLKLVQLKAGTYTSFGKDFVLSTLGAARIAVGEIGLGRTSIISLFIYRALYKDVFNAKEVLESYNQEIEKITEGLAKIDDINEETSSSQAENFRRLLLNLAGDVRVILIRLAEQMEIMREMKNFTEEEQYKIASEASFLYAPLAHRLGLYLIKSEMEDLSLKYTDRDNYSLIARKLAETMRARKSFIQEFTSPIREELVAQGFDFEIKGRPKSIYSIWNKMKKKEVEFEDIYDLFAIRIIIRTELKNEKADCWQVYSAVTDIYQPNPLRLRDWISVPKTNGYESLHTTVIGPGGRWVEVQIRTERMNEIAEKGVAAHWKYKGVEGEQGIDHWLTTIREILETPEQDAGNFIDDFKLSLYSKEIFVFTPKGDLRKFPEGASVLDFAYEIHTEVGATCTGARVNGRNVPIRHKMQNGDKVEIMTSKNQGPKLDWLNFVVTSKAQKKIRQQLDEQLVKEAENGKEIIKRRFKNWKVDYNDDVIRRILKYFRLGNAQEFYRQIFNEKIDLAVVKDYVTKSVDEEENQESILESLPQTKKQTQSSSRSEDYLIIDEKVANVDYRLAKCCSPIMGDNIFGFVTIGEGIKIHRTNCPNAVELIGKYGYRVVGARWTRRDSGSVFPVNIRITGEDSTSLLKNISEAIAKDLKMSVMSFNMKADGGMVSGKIALKVKDLSHLDNLISRLSQIKGIYSVTRLERNE
ncbi:MAG: bifunctional (p)ppGpp synthetase/guanosine-3',5'-bis(diphosphate) 3'-pyrophosphohydrolase [Bacteroidales bacterium]|nr:bifunctional (p)ppGpp synthetase/guanosine-3',5'-bis(diphosphate) 3'-pyrophosphohydrolase [Bacteroidales bacterium]